MKAVFAAVLVVAFLSSPLVIGLFVMRRSDAKARLGEPHVSSGEPAGSAPNEMRVSTWANHRSAIRLFVRAECNADVLTLSIGVPGPTVINREEVLSIEQVIGLFSSGLVFRSRDGRYDHVTVWPPGESFREELGSLGWPVSERGPRWRRHALADA